MSDIATVWAWENDSGHLKLTLLAIARAHDAETGDCHPSREWLARITGQSLRTIDDHLPRLRDAGFLSTFARMHPVSRERLDDGLILNIANIAGTPLSRNEPTATVAVDPPQLSRFLNDDPAARPQLTDRNKPPTRARSSAAAKDKEEADRSATEVRERQAAASEVWNSTPDGLKAKTSKATVVAALRDLGGDRDRLWATARGVAAFYRLNPSTDRLPAYLISDGDWKEPPPPPPAPVPAGFERWAPELWDGPAGSHYVGTLEQPGPMRQWDWLVEWRKRDYWAPDRGPEPGFAGCRVWPKVLDAFLQENPQ